MRCFLPFSFVVALTLVAPAWAQDGWSKLKSSLTFYAPFDGTSNARLSRGDGRVLTADSLARKNLTPGLTNPKVTIAAGQGKFGDCLRFADKSKEVVCFAGSEVPMRPGDWSTTISFWMRLDPDKDLKPGYCDPLQITQKAWNDAAIFVDFDKDLPRDFRLGVFSDLKSWNPDNVPWEKWPVDKRPMITVERPPFASTTWTHVACSLDHINTDQSSSVLYLNGQSQGSLQQALKFSWDPDRTAIMLGIEFIGDLDELMIFDRALSGDEVRLIFQSAFQP